jgi:predicted rRNA methylase YqxC with S4 and FtsJ domains
MRKGWFKLPGQKGDRTVDEQTTGLLPLFDVVWGKSVLDLGAAEGMIGAKCLEHGAMSVHGIEISKLAVNFGTSLLHGRNIKLHRHDLNDIAGLRALLAEIGTYDVCLMLAILHKLKRPIDLVDAVIEHHRPEIIVLRMPPGTPGYVKDSRSGNQIFDINARLRKHDFTLQGVKTGHFDEWVGYYA